MPRRAKPRPEAWEGEMHKIDMPQWAIDRSLERRGKLHPHETLDPRKTALIVVDLQNGHDHFTIMETLRDPAGLLTRCALHLRESPE
jgi:hypothetical protein